MAAKKPKELKAPKPKGSINAGEKRDMDAEKRRKAYRNAQNAKERARESKDYIIRDRDLGGGIGDTVYTMRNPGGAGNAGIGAYARMTYGEYNQDNADYRRKKLAKNQSIKKAQRGYANTQKPSKSTAKSKSNTKSKYR